MEKTKKEIRDLVNGIPPEIRRGIDGLLSPYGLTLDSMAPPGEGEQETKQSLDTVYLTVKQAEDYTHLCRWTIWQHAKKGSFRTLKTGRARRSKVLIDKKSLDKWLDSLAINN